MAAAASRDQALSLLVAANNHSDLAVKLSSLRQVKDILSSFEPSSAAELVPYLASLQRSPESLVRKFLAEIISDIGLKVMEHSSVLASVLLGSLRDSDSMVARQSIVSGTHLFCSVLEEMALQFQIHGKVERWLEELWIWTVKFKDAVFSIAVEPGQVGTKLLALKFLETYVLLFTSDTFDSEKILAEVTRGSRRVFNVSWLTGGHPVLDPVVLMSEANRALSILLDLLQSASSLPSSLTITVVNCLATIARKRPHHYGTVFSALLDFNPNSETMRDCHSASIQYSIRTAFLGFLRCTYPVIVESRDRLLRALRAMNAGDAADQVMRQVDKIIKNNERASREARLGRDEPPSNQVPFSGDLSKKRSMPQDNEESGDGFDMVSKRVRHGLTNHMTSSVQINDPGQDFASVNGLSPNVPLSDIDLTPAEQMIAMIGALLAEGERGAESLGILISKIHPDLLADIVIANMKNLPKTPPLARIGNLPITQQAGSLSSSTQMVAPPGPTNFMQSSVSSAPLPFPLSATTNSTLADTSASSAADSKRDPRRDPRRLDPRRAATSVGLPSPAVEDPSAAKPEFDGSTFSKPLSVTAGENPAPLLTSNVKDIDKIVEDPSISGVNQQAAKEDILGSTEENISAVEANASDHAHFPIHKVDEDYAAIQLPAVEEKYKIDASSLPESDQQAPSNATTSASDETSQDLPPLPLYVELNEQQQTSARKLAIKQIIEAYMHLDLSDCIQIRMALLARLVAQINGDDDIVSMLGKQVVGDYQQQKGHELVLHVLYHLYSLVVSTSVENSSYSALLYEKFLLAVGKSLLDTFPASDKSFSRLLGEVPFLPDSALKLLEDLCYSDVFDAKGKEVRDGERVTQGLGAVWSLILGRPNYRQACLGIALKCAVHSQDDVRGKAIRLVANKLYHLSYISGNIEQYATNMLLSAVDQNASDSENSQSGAIGQRTGEFTQVESHETSTSGFQATEPGTSGNEFTSTESVTYSASAMTMPEAQRLISLYFALCTKKPNLLQIAFNTYGRASKIVKQAFHRHIPIVIRALGSSYSELLHIISDPPLGSENLLTVVLQILTQETTPSPDLIATVKHLYETKLKDATILIPMLSLLSKNEVLPILPRLVDLPLEKFQLALAHILQGSAHTGPALTPAEVLVAIHDIRPEKDGLPLKKITDACSACFEQRTVFTHQVLAKALNQMVDQTPLPLLFMRTVIQAIDAFPTLVDFVMEILSKLVNKQVWRMPKLWVGFLKCVAQTQPHSFPVLLQLPPPQLEGALIKYSNLRGALAAYASQPSVKASLPRSTVAVLGLANEQHLQQPHMSTLHPSDNGSSVRETTLT